MLLVSYWINKKRPYKSRKISVQRINNKINFILKQTPCDFNRKLRTLLDARRWKATEFRFFLLYGVPFLLKNILNASLYEHFLLLLVAVVVLIREDLIKPYFTIAKHYLQMFTD